MVGEKFIVKPVDGKRIPRRSATQNLALVEISATDVSLPLEVLRKKEQEMIRSTSVKTAMDMIAFCELVAFPPGCLVGGDVSTQASSAVRTLVNLTNHLATVAAAVNLARHIVEYPHVFKISDIQALLLGVQQEFKERLLKKELAREKAEKEAAKGRWDARASVVSWNICSRLLGSETNLNSR
jgi:hypothetical protein